MRTLAKEPKQHYGNAVPFFDRLINDEPLEPFDVGSKKFYDLNGTIKSVHLEIARILNTRAFGPGLSFGLKDFKDGSNPQNWPQIGSLCQKALSYFEPRLRHITVNVVAFKRQTQSLDIVVKGEIMIDQHITLVVFPICLTPSL